MWINYDIIYVNNWYANNRDEKFNPKKLIGEVPFIVQQKISASYGPMQIMYESAYELGYREDPLLNDPANENSLLNYKKSIPISMDYYISRKMLAALSKKFSSVKRAADPNNKGHYVFEFPLDSWNDIYNYSMYYYNGAKMVNDVNSYKYPIEARTKEASVLPD